MSIALSLRLQFSSIPGFPLSCPHCEALLRLPPRGPNPAWAPSPIIPVFAVSPTCRLMTYRSLSPLPAAPALLPAPPRLLIPFLFLCLLLFVVCTFSSSTFLRPVLLDQHLSSFPFSNGPGMALRLLIESGGDISGDGMARVALPALPLVRIVSI